MKSILALLVFGKLIFFFWPRLGVEPRTCWIFAFFFASLWSHWRYLLPCCFTLKLEFSLQRPKKLEFELGWWNLSWKEVAGSKIPSPCSDCRKSSHDKPKALMSKIFWVPLAYSLKISLPCLSYSQVIWRPKLWVIIIPSSGWVACSANHSCCLFMCHLEQVWKVCCHLSRALIIH